MKNLKLKMLPAALVMVVMSLLVGCSDQITSSGENGTSDLGSSTSAIKQGQGLPVVQTYRFQIRVKPHRIYTFDLFDTGLDRYYGIDITNLSSIPTVDKYAQDCGDIAVYGISSKLECHSSGFDESKLFVENKGNSFLDLDVILKGIKQKKEPVKIAIDN